MVCEQFVNALHITCCHKLIQLYKCISPLLTIISHSTKLKKFQLHIDFLSCTMSSPSTTARLIRPKASMQGKYDLLAVSRQGIRVLQSTKPTYKQHLAKSLGGIQSFTPSLQTSCILSVAVDTPNSILPMPIFTHDSPFRHLQHLLSLPPCFVSAPLVFLPRSRWTWASRASKSLH